ncbi:error-prone DNA polymerase [Puniceicoccaceae bacterium K14]|nr:error-prone DNA polymerase [Puniceicoccaceae bacterium K14]
MSGYVELHARSAFSFLRGASQPDCLASACSNKGLEAMAVCDRNGFYGSARFHASAREEGIRAIVGCELEMEDESVIPVLIRTRQGYQNISQLLTRTHLSAPKGEGRVNYEDLAERAEGLIALTGDDEGPLRKAWLKGRANAVQDMTTRLKRIFGERNLYVELQRHRLRGEEVWLRSLKDLASTSGLSVVATNGVDYANGEGRAVHDLFTCLREKVTFDKSGSLLSSNGQRHVKSADSMCRLFSDTPCAIDNSLRIADRIEFTLENLGYEFPAYETPDGSSMDTYLKEIVLRGARKRFRGKLSAQVKRQLEHELSVIRRLEFSGYFLIVWDLVNYCRENRIMAQGRGSAANSVVCYCLEITPVDPVGAGLLFERFLNEERRSWPDIDIDLPSGKRREQVIQEVYRRYGRHGAAMTANVITYRGKSAAREVGKVLGFPEESLGRFSSVFGRSHYDSEEELEEQLEKSGIDSKHPRARAMAKLYNQVLGLPRHLGQHSGGMIICQGKLDTVVPLEPASMPGRTVSQWDKNDCEDLGIIKVDLLGLGMMAVMQDTMEELNKKGIDIELATIPKDDEPTFEMMRRADTVGVFQIESRAQIATLPRMQPKDFYDVVVEVGVIRPGPIQGKMVHPYLERREDPSKIAYIDPRLVDTLKRTLGVPIFQEQILKVAMVMANFTGSQAEELRRAVSTFSSNEKRMNRVLSKLILAMEKRGVSPDKIDQVIQAVSSFAHYGFPESHAISFGLLAYASTYLKCHHGEEFYVALLNNQPMGFYSPATLLQDAKRHGIRVKPVCVERSQWHCSVPEKGVIRLGLIMVKALKGENARQMVGERKKEMFYSLRDFRRRTVFDKDELRQLASVGALNCFEHNRRQALWAVETMHDAQDLFSNAEEAEELNPLEIMNHIERLQADYAGIGVTVGSHPMASFRSHLPNVWKTSDLDHTPNGARVKVAGQVICRQRPGTAKGFVFISLEDETGISNSIVLPKLFERMRLVITQEPYLIISGKLQNQKGVIHVKADKIEAIEVKGRPASASYDFH